MARKIKDWSDTKRNVEEPVTVQSKSAVAEFETSHPAFAQIGAYRVQGGNVLYDSDFQHQHYITISIKRSKLMRGLNRDWHYANREELINVAMSESQWATFISTPNSGDGVCCTLERLNGEFVPGLPMPKPRHDQFAAKLLANMETATKALQDAIAHVDTLGLSGKKAKEMQDIIRTAHGALHGYIPFIASQFDEHMENTTEAAKQEIHGYMTNAIQRAGLEALGAADMPILIELKTDETP